MSHLTKPLTVLSSTLTVCVALLSPLGCQLDDASPADETDTDGGTGGASTGSSPTTTAPADESSSSGDASSSDGGSTDTTDDGADEDPDEGDDTTDGPPEPMGLCVGYDLVGNVAQVFEASGAALPEPACSDVASGCGGDVVGTWVARTSCGYEALPNPLEAECPGSQYEVEVVEESGELDLVADGTLSWTTSRTTISTLTFDSEACFEATCAEVQAELMRDSPDVACDTIEDSCACVFSELEAETLTGGWEVADDQLALTLDTDEGEVEEEFEFCVGDDRLDLWQPIAAFTVTDEPCDGLADCTVALGETHDGYVCVEPEDR